MATIDALKYAEWISIFILVTFIVSTPAVKYCYNGSDINSGKALLNQSCNTGDVHLPKTLVTNYQTLPPIQDDKKFDGDQGDPSGRLLYDKADHCLIFRHVSTHMLSPGLKQESVHVNFGCDITNICGDKESNKILYNAIVNGTKGQLYCCATENCNKQEKLPHFPAENRICYHGTNNRSEPPTAEQESCLHPDVMCAKMTTFLPGAKIERYYCDNEKLCQIQMSSGSYKSCTNTSVDNVTQEMCCCDNSKCFEPPWADALSDLEDKNTTSRIHFTDIRTISKPSKKRDDKLLITGLVASLVLITGIAAGIIFMMACKKRRQPRRNPNVIMQYERLSASDLEVEDAVVV